MPQLFWEDILNQDAILASGTVPQAKAGNVTKNLCRNVEDCSEERHVGDEAKAAVKQVLPDELPTLVEESLYDVLRSLYQSPHSATGSVVLSVVEQEMLDLFHKEDIDEILKAHKAKFIGAYRAAERPSKKFLTLTSFMAPITTFV